MHSNPAGGSTRSAQNADQNEPKSNQSNRQKPEITGQDHQSRVLRSLQVRQSTVLLSLHLGNEAEMTIDDMDRKILRELQKNARISYAKLARIVNLSQPAVFSRIKRLETKGIIQKYIALIDMEKTNNRILIFLEISFQQDEEILLKEFIRNRKDIMEAHKKLGSDSYILRMRYTNLNDYEEFSQDLKLISKNIFVSNEFISVENVKNFTGFSTVIC
ncbi:MULTISPECIES: Lrp/AsnC family transcriptional regulator [Asaia]|uniref:Lrp/AsnC family transcriptional regulator n=1 Tax=Asaia TaxID=91914 RepID=UPI002FC2B62E